MRELVRSRLADPRLETIPDLQDVSLEPTQDGCTRMRWGLYYAPSRSLRLLHPLARTMFSDMLTQSSQALVRYVMQEENVARISITHLVPVPTGPTRRFKLPSRPLPHDGTLELDRRAPTP